MRRPIAPALSLILFLGCGAPLERSDDAINNELDLVASTTKTQLSANDTSASSLFTDLYTPASRFGGSTTPVSNGDAPPGSVTATSLTQGSVSKVSIRSLVGSGPKIFVETQTWFCTNGHSPLGSSSNTDQCGSHIDIGYGSNIRAQVQKQVADMRSRGIDGVLMDWMGRGAAPAIDTFSTSGPAINTGALFLFKQAAEATGGAFQFAVIEDEGIKACAKQSGCDVTQAMIADIAYLADNVFDSPAYLHYGGRPALFFFSEDYWAAQYGKTIDWNKVRSVAKKNPVFVFENAGGFTHSHSDGAYAWLTSGSDPLGYIGNFYNAAAAHSALLAWGATWKGFDDAVVNGWGSGTRFSPQKCGKTWLDTAAAAKAHASLLDGIQLPTWDDYEEGTELETGIENHLNITASVSGTKLSWSVAPKSSAPSDCLTAVSNGFDIGRTVSHYAIYASSDGENLALVADNVDASARTIDLSGKIPADATTLYVYAVGQPMIHNHLSNAVSYGGGSGSSSSTSSSSSSSSSSGSGGGGGDGCSGVPAILEPTNGQSVGPAIRLRVSAPSCIEAMIAYIDGSSAVKVTSNAIDQWVPVTMGTHSLVVNGWAGTNIAHSSTQITFTRTY